MNSALNSACIVILIENYKVTFGGGDKPHIIVTLGRGTTSNMRTIFSEFRKEFTHVVIKFSTDVMIPKTDGKLSVVVSIDSPSTEIQKIVSDAKNAVTATCNITSQHPKNVVKTLFTSCQNVIQNRGNVPVLVKDYMGTLVCRLESSEICEFSWAEVFKEMQILHSKKEKKTVQ